jgi:uncharacterized protein (DUF983 family)
MNPPVPSSDSYRTILLRGLRRRCPRCGAGSLPFRKGLAPAIDDLSELGSGHGTDRPDRLSPTADPDGADR